MIEFGNCEPRTSTNKYFCRRFCLATLVTVTRGTNFQKPETKSFQTIVSDLNLFL